MRHLSWHRGLAVRSRGIGSSDAAAAVGLSPYKSPLSLWLEKTGRQPAADLSEKGAVFWGTVLEPVIADVYAQKTGATVRRVNAILQHPQHPFVLANLDRAVLHPQDGPGLLEIKTAGLWSASRWEEGIPEDYQCQVYHQLAVTNRAWADVAVLLGGQEFRIYRLERNEQVIQGLLEAEQHFWQYVTQDQAPPVDGSTSSAEALAFRYPQNSSVVLDFSESIEHNTLFTQLLQAREQKSVAAAEEALYRQKIQEALGEASGAKFHEGQVRWKKSRDGQQLDIDRLTQDHPELIKHYSEPKPGTRRFTIQMETHHD